MLWRTQMIRRKWRFRVALSFSWKARLRTKPLIWKCFFIFIFTQIKLIFTRKVSHLASFWKWEFLELGTPFNFSLLTDWFSPPVTRELVRTLSIDSQEVGKKVQLLLRLTLLSFYPIKSIYKVIISCTSKNTLLSPNEILKYCISNIRNFINYIFQKRQEKMKDSQKAAK